MKPQLGTGRSSLAAAALILLACPVAVWAAGQLPLITDIPETPRRGTAELDMAYALDSVRLAHDEVAAFGRHTRLDMSIPIVQLNYGITRRLQGRLESELALTTLSPATATTAGVGDASGGVKYRFLDQAEDSDSDENEEDEPSSGTDAYAWEAPLAASLFPQWTFPSGSARRGLGSGEYSLFLPLDVSRDFEHVTVVGEGAFVWRYHHPAGPNEFEIGAAAYYELIPALLLAAEQRVNLPTVGHGTAEWLFNFGALYQLRRDLVLFGSAGRSVRASARVEEVGLAVLLGFEVTLGAPY